MDFHTKSYNSPDHVPGVPITYKVFIYDKSRSATVNTNCKLGLPVIISHVTNNKHRKVNISLFESEAPLQLDSHTLISLLAPLPPAL